MTDLKTAPQRPYIFVPLETFEWEVPEGTNRYLQGLSYTVRPGINYDPLEAMILHAESISKVRINRPGEAVGDADPAAVTAGAATASGSGKVR